MMRSTLARVVIALAAAGAAGGCATKKDLKNLRAEVLALQARQDSLFGVLSRQNRTLMDTLRRNSEMTSNLRGDIGHQLLELAQQVVQVQELAGQSHMRISEIRQQLEARTQELQRPAPAPGMVDTVAAARGDVAAAQLYTAAVEQLERGAAGTARRGFEQFLREFPQDARAPDAQFNLAETYVRERQYDRGLEELDKVVSLYPNSTRAPAALYRAGVIAEERGNKARARRYFDRVVSGYPRSDEARVAREKLKRLTG